MSTPEGIVEIQESRDYAGHFTTGYSSELPWSYNWALVAVALAFAILIVVLVVRSNKLEAFLTWLYEAVCELFRILRWDLGMAPRSHYALVA